MRTSRVRRIVTSEPNAPGQKFPVARCMASLSGKVTSAAEPFESGKYKMFGKREDELLRRDDGKHC